MMYAYAQQISFQFAGIGGPERALAEGGWPYRSGDVIEKRPAARRALETLHGDDAFVLKDMKNCLLYTSPSPRDKRQSRMPSSA